MTNNEKCLREICKGSETKVTAANNEQLTTKTKKNYIENQRQWKEDMQKLMKCTRTDCQLAICQQNNRKKDILLCSGKVGVGEIHKSRRIIAMTSLKDRVYKLHTNFMFHKNGVTVQENEDLWSKIKAF